MDAEPESVVARVRYVEQLAEMTDLIFRDVSEDGAIRPHEQLGFDKSNMIRLKRALSWLRRDLEIVAPEPDISFITNWIAFEAIYNNEKAFVKQGKDYSLKRMTTFIELIGNISRESQQPRLREALERSWIYVTNLLNNSYINQQCWEHYYQGTTKAGPKHNPFNDVGKKLTKKMLKDPKQFPQLIWLLFSRLYCLRNQVFHGSATYKGGSDAQRSGQINDGMQVMRNMMPVFIHIMLDDLENSIADKKWGKVIYPRIKVG